MTAETPPGKRGWPNGEFYRQCRIWHGYLSALAFIALIFFSMTGILLNHPGLLSLGAPAPVEQQFTLSQDELTQVRAAAEPARKLAEITASRFSLAGAYRNGEVVGEDIFINLQGVRGSSNIRANLATGAADVVIERQDAATVLNELHRGEHAGGAWRLAIDILAILLIAVSLVGFVLFLSLRLRMRTALALTAASLAGLIGIFVFAVP
jgi:uncharacterized protein